MKYTILINSNTIILASEQKSELEKIKTNPTLESKVFQSTTITQLKVIDALKTPIGNSPKQIEDIIKKISSGMRLNENEINILNCKMISNNPTLGIFTTLNDGDEYIAIIFSGIKGLNDTFSQAFTDNILNKFKYKLLNNYPGANILWNDYKNLFIKLNNGSIISNDTINNILDLCYNEELEKEQIVVENIPKLKTISKKGIIEGNSQEDIMYSLANTRSKLENQIHNNIVLNPKDLIQKLSNMVLHYGYNGIINERTSDERGRTRYITRKGILHKKYTIAETGKIIIDRILILDAEGNINPKIIELVRKKKIPSHLQIFKDVNEIIKSAVSNGEFIGPYIRDNKLSAGTIIQPNLVIIYKEIQSKLIKGTQLDINETNMLKYFTQNTYKKALDKKTFYKIISKPGELFFIDIVGMGNINIQDFINKLTQYNSGKITKKDLLLNSGSYMTINFQNLMSDLKSSLKHIYPGKQIDYYIGGDEIGIFIEGVDTLNPETTRRIYDELDENLLEGRITKTLIKQNNIDVGAKNIFDELDKLTKYSKVIEERINEAIQKINTDAKRSDIKNYNEIVWTLTSLKYFDITEKQGQFFIEFYPEDDITIFNGGNIFNLEKILNYDSLQLRDSSVSPFIDYLINNHLSR